MAFVDDAMTISFPHIYTRLTTHPTVHRTHLHPICTSRPRGMSEEDHLVGDHPASTTSGQDKTTGRKKEGGHHRKSSAHASTPTPTVAQEGPAGGSVDGKQQRAQGEKPQGRKPAANTNK